jgi:hypothetical protein
MSMCTCTSAQQKAYEYIAAQVLFPPLERLHEAHINPCSCNRIIAVRHHKQRHVVSRCLRRCGIAARSFGLRRREPGCSDGRPIASGGSALGTIAARSLEGRRIQSSNCRSAKGCEHSVHCTHTPHR